MISADLPTEQSRSARGAGAPGAATLQVLLATLLFSAVAPVAKLVPFEAGVISFFRAAFGGAALLALLAVRRGVAPQAGGPRGLVASAPGARGGAGTKTALIAMGLLTAGNWYLFVLAAQISTVAIAVVCLFTYPFLTALVEPWATGEPFRLPDLLGGVLVVLGCALLVERLDGADASLRGALCGVLSAVCLSLRNVLNRRAVERYSPATLTLYQFVVAGLALLPALAGLTRWPTGAEWALLVLIGGVLTACSHVLFTAALRVLSATFASLLLSLQPVLAIGIAFILLGEVPSWRAALGAVAVAGAIALSWAGRRAG